jgi:hypothetical protein
MAVVTILSCRHILSVCCALHHTKQQPKVINASSSARLLTQNVMSFLDHSTPSAFLLAPYTRPQNAQFCSVAAEVACMDNNRRATLANAP